MSQDRWAKKAHESSRLQIVGTEEGVEKRARMSRAGGKIGSSVTLQTSGICFMRKYITVRVKTDVYDAL